MHFLAGMVQMVRMAFAMCMRPWETDLASVRLQT